MFTTLIEDYQLDIDNAAIYYLFDRDPASNTHETFIRNMLSSLASARDINADMTRQGMLLLAYPRIESFVGMNLLENSIQYCRIKGVQSGSDLKRALHEDGLLANNINEQTILHCADELFRSLEMIGVNTENEAFMNSLDHFAENNSAIYEWQEAKRKESQQYGLLSLMAVALLDLGLIKISE